MGIFSRFRKRSFEDYEEENEEYQVEGGSVDVEATATLEGTSLELKIFKPKTMAQLLPAIDHLRSGKTVLLNLEGVYLLQDSKRYYPYGTLLSNVLGFSGVDNQGLAGVEAYYNEYLQGVNGSLNYYMDAKGGLFSNLKSNIVSPSAGLSISLTIDYNIL